MASSCSQSRKRGGTWCLIKEETRSLGGRRGVVVTRLIRSAKLLYAGPGSVMGDCLWAGTPSRDVTNHLGQLSLSSLRGR